MADLVDPVDFTLNHTISIPSTTVIPNNYSDPTNDFYVHPNENPSLVLVAPALDGPSNYYSWSRSMTMSLQMKNKFGFVDGSITKPNSTDFSFPYWKRCNTLVISWLTRSMTTEVVQSIIFFDLASDIWKDLKDRFSQGDYVRISQIYSELYSLKQAESSVNSYYTKLRILWDELANFQPIPSTSCCAVSKLSMINILASA